MSLKVYINICMPMKLFILYIKFACNNNNNKIIIIAFVIINLILIHLIVCIIILKKTLVWCFSLHANIHK